MSNGKKVHPTQEVLLKKIKRRSKAVDIKKLIVGLERPAHFCIEVLLTARDLDTAAGLKGMELIEFIGKRAMNPNWSAPSDIVNCRPKWETAEPVGEERL